MKKEYSILLKYLEEEKKDNAVMLVLDLLDKNKKSIKDVYYELLIPAMKNIRVQKENNEINELDERMREEILKTVIEATYPYIIKEKKENLNKKVLIASPEGEYEQVGALIANNIFALNGFNTYYIGANLSEKQILLAIETYKPDYFTIGLKSFYNAVETKQLIDKIKTKYETIKIIVGGPVFKKEEVQKLLKHDYFVRDYREIFEIAAEVKHEVSTKDCK